MIKLRDYQTEAVVSIYTYFQTKTGNPLIAMPTATGKSVVIAGFLDSIYRQWPTQKVMILTHVKELIRQNYEKLLMYWPFAPAGIYSAGLNKRDVNHPIIFAGIASVVRRAAEFGHVDLVMIDEAHLLGPNDNTMYQKFLTALRAVNPHLKVIGLTATPFRLGHGHIASGGGLFDDVCFDITTFESFNRLIAEGYLSPLVPKNTKLQISTDGVRITAGEFNSADLEIAVDREEITRVALKEALEQAHDRKHWLIFSSGIMHAEHIKDMMEDFGQTCGIVHSRMPTKDRDQTIKDFQEGKIRAIVNNNILTTGFDSPWVDCIVCLRPTASSGLWVQMLGRGTRPFLGNEIDPVVKKNCLALDFAGNTRRLGPINDPLIPNPKGKGNGEAPVKCCDVCDTWNHISVRYCTFCGNEFKFAVKIRQEASPLELIKGEMPKVQVFKVDHITCREYIKQGRPPILKISYYCGLKVFEEFVCIEHDGYAQKKAREWWRLRTEFPMPATTADALNEVAGLPAATHIRVWTNKKYPEILAACFDGTAFNKEPPTQTLPYVQVDKKIRSQQVAVPQLDEDIPF